MIRPLAFLKNRNSVAGNVPYEEWPELTRISEIDASLTRML
jgi:hypothetical protein